MIHFINSLLVATALASTSVSVTSNDYARQRVYEEFGNDPIMLSIIDCESDFMQFTKKGGVVTHFNKDKSFDLGIAQINSLAWGDDAKERGNDLNTVDGNLAQAKIIIEKQGYSAWVCHKTTPNI